MLMIAVLLVQFLYAALTKGDSGGPGGAAPLRLASAWMASTGGCSRTLIAVCNGPRRPSPASDPDAGVPDDSGRLQWPRDANGGHRIGHRIVGDRRSPAVTSGEAKHRLTCGNVGSAVTSGQRNPSFFLSSNPPPPPSESGWNPRWMNARQGFSSCLARRWLAGCQLMRPPRPRRG